MRFRCKSLCPLLFGACLALPAAAQESAAPGDGAAPALAGPLVTAARITDALTIDGRLEEDLWRSVQPATRFIQSEPDEGQPASEATEVYIAYDDDALYIGARLRDSTGAVSRRLARRDSWLSDSDWLSVMLDSHHDHLTAYQFSINPAGVKRDELLSNGRNDESWDAVWEAATHVDAEGWSVELRIPFSQLRFPARSEHVWGVQVSRRIARRQEVSVLAFTPRSERGGVATFGHLLGLRALQQAERFEVLPYTLARAEYRRVSEDNPFRDGSDFFRGAGLDVKYRVTSALTLDATVNPDFGQVEVDPATVNLSAYETSYEEKRPFFVEGSDIFRFGGEGRGLYYSRRIGRAPQGSLPDDVVHADRPDASTILGAAKLTGRTQRGWSLGVLSALTAEESARWQNEGGERGSTAVEPRTAYAVARVRRSLRGGQTNVGAIATGMRRSAGDSALTATLRESALAGGIDFTHEFLNRTWSVEGSVAGSLVCGSASALTRTQLSSARYFNRPDADYLAVDSARTDLSGYSMRLELGKRAGLHWRGEASISATSPGYEINDVGFQTTVDRINANGTLLYVENQPGLLRNYRVYLSGGSAWNFGHDLVDASASLRLEGQLLNYWSGAISGQRGFPSYSDRLTRGGPVMRDPPGYNIGGNVSSDGRRKVSGRVQANYSWGSSGGWHRGTSFHLSLRPSENWSVSMGPRHDRSLGAAQYLRSVEDSTMRATFGRRYLFSEIRQATWSMETRLNVNVTPELSFDVYAQPFISSGDYGAPRQLERPREFAFQQFGRDIGTIRYDAGERYYEIDPDAAGPAEPFTLSDRDFSELSLRGNAVLRWEWRPGSTVFFVWQQARAQRLASGAIDLTDGAADMFEARPSSTYVLKVNYWLNL